MSPKRVTTNPPVKKGRRVIAVQSYTSKSGESHSYGHEFEHPVNAELSALLEKGVLRVDDRGAPPSPPKPPSDAADAGA